MFNFFNISKLKKKIPDFIGCLIIFISWLILFRSWLIGNRFIPFDAMDQFYPCSKFIVESLKSGQLPFWNPYIFSGYPAISDPQFHIFSWIFVTLLSIPENLTVHWFNVVVVLHCLIGSVGLYFILRSYGLSPYSAIIGSLVFLCGGSASGRMQHIGMILSYSYFPWAFLFLKKMLDTLHYRFAVLFGIFAGLMALHQNQVAFLFSWFLIAYLINRIITARDHFNFLKTRILPVLAGGFIAAIILLPQFYATQLFLPYSNRPVISFETASALALKPLAFLTLFAPNAYGNLVDIGKWCGPNDITVSYLYIGIIPASLLIYIGLFRGFICKKFQKFFLIMFFIYFLYAIGAYTPVYKIIFELLPGAKLFRRPSDCTFPLNFIFAVLVAVMSDYIYYNRSSKNNGNPTILTQIISICVVIYFLIILIWSMIHSTRFGHLDFFIRNLFTSVFLLILCIGVLRVIEKRKNETVRILLCYFLLIFLICDYHHYNIPNQLNAHSNKYISMYFHKQDPLMTFLQSRLENEDQLNIPYRVEFVNVSSLLWNGPMAFNIHSTQGQNPLYIARYDAFEGVKTFNSPPNGFTDFIKSYKSQWFDFLNVKFIVTTKILTELDPLVRNDEFPLVKDIGGVHIYENTGAMKRAFLVSQAFIANDESNEKSLLLSPGFDPQQCVVLNCMPENVSKDIVQQVNDDYSRICFNPVSNERVNITSYKLNKVHIQVDTSDDSFLVLADSFFPGWQVTIDGELTEMLQANYAFRAVYVPKGKHEVIFRFRPFSLKTIKTMFKRRFAL